jgi:NADPH-dependent curcumin reductase
VLEDELGFSATINRRSPTFASELQATCRDGVDAYFDNVGNPLLDKILPLMADHGCVVGCCAVAVMTEWTTTSKSQARTAFRN